MGISDYLNPNLVTFLDVNTRDEAIGEMVTLLHQQNVIDDVESFREAIIDREKIVSTGIGMGVAIPHAKLASCRNFFVALGILSHSVDWKALDGAPVRLIFMIGGPDDKQTEYLQILSSLTLAMKDEERRKKMLQLSDPQDIIDLFQTF